MQRPFSYEYDTIISLLYIILRHFFYLIYSTLYHILYLTNKKGGYNVTKGEKKKKLRDDFDNGKITLTQFIKGFSKIMDIKKGLR